MLKPKEIAEISLVLWYLPLAKVEEIKKLVLELKKQHGYDEPIDDSDEWTEEDKQEIRLASMRHAEATIPYDEDDADAIIESASANERKNS